MKKLACVVLSLVILLGISACGESADTPAKSSGPTAAEKAYISDLSDDLGTLSKAMKTIGREGTKYPNWNENDVIRVAGAVATFRVAKDSWTEREAPSERLEPLREKWLRCLTTYTKGVNRFASSADSGDYATMMESVTYMNRGTKQLNAVGDEMTSLYTTL